MKTNNITEYFQLETDEEFLQQMQKKWGYSTALMVALAEIKAEEENNIRSINENIK